MTAFFFDDVLSGLQVVTWQFQVPNLHVLDLRLLPGVIR
jgi:hypothetical protein